MTLPTPTAAPAGRNKSASPGAAVRPALDAVQILLPTIRATDGDKGGPNQRGSSGDLTINSAIRLLPTITVQDGDNDGSPSQAKRNTPPLNAEVTSSTWGRFTPAINRWADIIGRPAPPPTIDNGKGKQVLSPLLTEWMMGLPAGWITDVPGISRRQAINLRGDGVVAQQAYAAICDALDTFDQLDSHSGRRVRILTVRQPWAWAIIHGGKDVENRSRNIAGQYRGPVAIHVSKTADEIEYDDPMYALIHEPCRVPEDRHYSSCPVCGIALERWTNMGSIIGVVDLVEVHQEADCWMGYEDLSGFVHTESCSPWASTEYQWHLVFANPRPITPIPARGRLGLWHPDEQLLQQIEEALS